MKPKRKFSILASLFLVFSLILVDKEQSSEKSVAESKEPTAFCLGIANDSNNNVLENSSITKTVDLYRVLLKYDCNLGDAANSTNVVSSTGAGISINGKKLSEIEYAVVDYAHGSTYLQIKIPKAYEDSLTGDIYLEVASGTIFENKVLDSAKFVLDGNKWKKITSVDFVEVRWNNMDYDFYGGKKGVLLNFSKNLSNSNGEINGGLKEQNFVSTVGEHIYLGENKLSSLPGGLVSYYAQSFMFIYAENMSAYRSLKIDEGTLFVDVCLPEVNLYFDSGAWGLNQKTFNQAIFDKISWNNMDYDFYGGKKGILLAFKSNLSNDANEANGKIKDNNLAAVVGDKILVGGHKLSTLPGALVSYFHTINIFIYADGLAGYRTIEIEEGTKFLDSTLPEIKLYFNADDEWGFDSVEATEIVFDKIEWNNTDYQYYGNKNGVLLSFKTNLSKVNSEANDGKLKNFNYASTIGEKIIVGGHKLSTLPGALVSYYQSVNLFIYADYLPSYRSIKIEAGTVFLDSILPEINLYFDSQNLWNFTKNVPTPVNFTGIVWNNIGYEFYNQMNGVLLSFSGNLSKYINESEGRIQSANFASSLGENIYLGEKQLSSIEGAFVSYHSNNLLFIYAPNMISNKTLTIEQCVFIDTVLPDVILYSSGSSWSSEYIAYHEQANCLGVANDENNNILEPGSATRPARYRVLLRYDRNFGPSPTTTNVASIVGQGILLNNVKLSDIPGSVVDYAHGTVYLDIKIPKDYLDSLSGDIVLEIIKGTVFENHSLDYIKFVLRGGQWVIYKEPTNSYFSSVLWNNTSNEIYNHKKGLLLSFSDNISDVPNEINGSMQTTNLVNEEIGNKIKFDGVALKNIANAEVSYFGGRFLWIYVPNITSYKNLTIESFTFIATIFSETHLHLFDDMWAESFSIKHIINGVQKIEYYKKRDSISLNEKFYQTMFEGSDLTVKLINFKVDGHVYKNDESLSINSDTIVEASLVGFETTKGASIKLTNPSSMRFETKILKEHFDYLSSTFGINNIEFGTYVVPSSLLEGISFSNFINDSNNVEGRDYFKITSSSFDNQTSAESDGFYKYFGVMNSISSNNYGTEYIGVGYLKITDNSEVCNIYGANDSERTSRSIYEVAKRAYDKYETGSNEKNMLNSFLDGAVSIVSDENGLKIENLVNGFETKYSLNFDASKNEYSIVGNNELNNVYINGKKIDERTNLIVNIKNRLYKVTDFNIDKNGGSSLAKFKISEVSKALDMVDFAVEIPSNRDMRILQLTDTQIIDSSQMRKNDRLGEGAIELYSRKNIDKNCFNHIRELVEQENPDLILFTGDIVYGEFDDSGEIWTMMVNFMESLNVPWAPIFGNHDNETNRGVNWQCEQLENAHNCLFKQNNLTGNGNYSIGLIDENGKINRVIYMLDSNGCLRGPTIENDQTNWMKSVSNSIEQAYGEKIPAFVCLHIPTQDFMDAYMNKYGYERNDNFSLNENGLDGDFGSKKENMSYIPASYESTFKLCNVDGVFAGHDHVNNFSILYNGIRYTYGTKTGTYDYYNKDSLGGTLILLKSKKTFEVSHIFVSEDGVSKDLSNLTKVTIMSDLHNDTQNYGGFHCLETKEKFEKIMEETKDSDFYINLGDTVNSCVNNLNNYYEMISLMKHYGLNVYNSQGTGYEEGNKMMYNLLGNHEVAYNEKSDFKDYIPYEDGIGSAGVFINSDMLFVSVDALFDRNGFDDPEHILPCTEFTIPDAEINYLKQQVSNNMNNSIKGIVWISHVALQDIDATSKNKLLSYLKSYELPMTVFEGHTHIENYSTLTDSSTGKVYCEVYTLPAVVLEDNYKYYNVYFENGKVKFIDKKNGAIK